MNKTARLMFILCSCIICSLCLTSCSKKMVYDKILFGKGGGFTGKYDDYFIARNGSLYKKDAATKAFTKIKDIPKKETAGIFKDIDAGKLFEVGFNNPYNITCYLEICMGEISNRIVWGDAKNPPPPEVIALFSKLMGMVAVDNGNRKGVKK